MNASKIIKGVVGSGRYTVTAPIVKEDYGLYLKIEGLELPSTYEVDFSNQEHNGTSVTMIGNSDGVLIPHQFIDSGKDIFAFLYHVGEDYGRTIFKFRIPNKLRPDRTNEEPTPEEQSVIDQAISALNDAVEQTAQDKADADVSAQNASADAERAEEARTDAQNYASSANTSSDAAYRSASSAQLFASQAETSAQSAEQSAERAEQARDTAEGFASVASTNASESAQSAVNALTSARMAEDAKTSAQTSAQTASAKASEASQSASTASTQASEALSSALSASGYANTAESAKTASQTAQGLAESARDSAISAQESAEDARDEAQALVDGISGKVEQIDSNTERIESLEDDIYKPYAVDSASGAVASFTDGADGLPLKSLVVDINPVQDTSGGDPSPENICPISGWTQVEVNHSDADMTNPTTITIDLGQTVYGAKLYPLEGKLVVDRAKYIESGQANWIGGSTGNAWRWFADVLNPLATIPTSQSGLSKAMSDKFKATYTVWSDPQTTVGFLPRGTRLWIRFGADTELTTAQKVKEWFTANPTEFVYELAEPLTIQLTPQQVNSLLGVNNIWADTGDTSCEYRADTKLYIERLTAPDSADMIADANITSGKYFMVGNSLYKATANIASGGQITVGTNCIRKSLSEALNEINA